MKHVRIYKAQIPIKRSWWEVLLRKPKYDDLQVVKFGNGAATIYVNGMLQDGR